MPLSWRRTLKRSNQDRMWQTLAMSVVFAACHGCDPATREEARKKADAARVTATQKAEETRVAATQAAHDAAQRVEPLIEAGRTTM